jgi:hypothetical protein
MHWMIAMIAMPTLTAKIKNVLLHIMAKIYFCHLNTINKNKKKNNNDKNLFLPYQFKYTVINNHH